INQQGRAILLEHYDTEGATAARMKMVEWPVGASVIPNPINQVPGFSLYRHHFVPRFPSMAWPMVDWVLDTYYAQLQHRPASGVYLFEGHDTPQNAISVDMQAVVDAHPNVRIACLPNAAGKRLLEFGVRGTPAAAASAYEALYERLQARQIPLSRTQPPQ